MTDTIYYPTLSPSLDFASLTLTSLSIPSWLRPAMGEAARPVRVLGVDVGLKWIILFDCANWLTPSGELFVLSRFPVLSDSDLALAHKIVIQNGADDFKMLDTKNCPTV
eukprot:TRINITY_DN2929_c0_g1_i1.p1 TRINITY_DN2929_c0_g1~~TRINITY_DN2929_c0_g1_i1.p1  ORF type:complete len:109 (+),score=41.86 TRINITY_DN2929_c0_g1_i1:512-838(+)